MLSVFGISVGKRKSQSESKTKKYNAKRIKSIEQNNWANDSHALSLSLSIYVTICAMPGRTHTYDIVCFYDDGLNRFNISVRSVGPVSTFFILRLFFNIVYATADPLKWVNTYKKETKIYE